MIVAVAHNIGHIPDIAKKLFKGKVMTMRNCVVLGKARAVSIANIKFWRKPGNGFAVTNKNIEWEKDGDYIYGYWRPVNR